MTHCFKDTLSGLGYRLFLGLEGLSFVLNFVGCGPHTSNSNMETVRAFEDSLYLECLKDSTEFGDFGYYLAFNNESFTHFIKTNVSSLTYPFEKLQDIGCVSVKTSEDGNFRIYQWEANTHPRWGGVEYLIQYKAKNGKIKTTDDFFELLESSKNDEYFGLEGLNNISIVCSVVNKEGQTIYVIDMYGRADTQYGNHLIAAFCIDGEALKEYKAFEKGKSYLYIEYGGIADWYFRTGGLGWEWVNSYDKNDRAIYVPHFVYSDNMIDRYDVYQFDGEIFKKTRTDGGFWLNPKLRDFTELKTVFKTHDYLIRVDAVGDGIYRYTSWENGKTMLNEPDLEIIDGLYEEDNNRFVFTKEECDYIVDDGQGGRDEGLIVKHNGNVLIQQNREY